MNIISVGPLLLTLLVLIACGALSITALGYLFRPKLRGAYPGGPRRFLLALLVQSVCLAAPIPFALIFLNGLVPRVFLALLAVLCGFAVLMLASFLPGVGPLLRDLAQAQRDIAQKNGPAYPRPPEDQLK